MLQRARRFLRQTIGERALLTRSGLLAWFVGCATLSVAGEMEFTRHEIGRAGNKMGQTSLVDGDNDVVRPQPLKPNAKIAPFDPMGETGELLEGTQKRTVLSRLGENRHAQVP